MFGSASRIAMRNVSADFCAVAGAVPSRAAARTPRPRTSSARAYCPPLCCPDAKHALCQMALYHLCAGAGHGLRRLTAAALDRDAAARMEPAAGRDVRRIGHGVAQPDIRHAEAGLRRQHARRAAPGCRDGAGARNSASVSLRSTMRPRYITATSLATCSTTARLWLMNR